MKSKEKRRAVFSWLARRIARMAPPGMDWKTELKGMGTGMALSAAVSLAIFVIRLNVAYQSLFESYWEMGVQKRRLAEYRMMAPFADVTAGAMIGFGLLMLLVLVTTVYHYAYFYRDSKSIYLMKRLPSGLELHRRCVLLPLAGVGLCLCAVILLLLIYFGIYLLVTPEGHGMPDQWWWFWQTRAFIDRIWTGG